MKRICVVGDVILDEYQFGRTSKPNPEGMGKVVLHERTELRPGGAAAVAMLCRCLGACPILGGVIGDDDAHELLYGLLRDFEHVYVPTEDRPTTHKVRRIVDDRIQPGRWDRETTVPISPRSVRQLSSIPLGDVLVIQDYGKGVCTRELLQALIGRAREAGIPVLVDPARGRPWKDYEGATIIKANYDEAVGYYGVAEFPGSLANCLSSMVGCAIVVTDGRHGMWWAKGDGHFFHVSTPQVNVVDVCGAGDTVLAVLAVATAHGMHLGQACVLAAQAAAQQVQQLGVGPICLPNAFSGVQPSQPDGSDQIVDSGTLSPA